MKEQTSIISDNNMWKKLDKLHTKFQFARENIIQLLDNHDGYEVQQLRYAIFSQICDALYENAKSFHGYTNEFAFYFWPGYDSIRTPHNIPTRISLEESISNIKRYSVSTSIKCGLSPSYSSRNVEFDRESALERLHKRETWLADKLFGVNAPENRDIYKGLLAADSHENIDFRFLNTPCAFWFWLILTPPTISEDSSYSPGSTHRWVSEKSFHLDDDKTVRWLEVNCTSRAHQSSTKSFCSIAIKKKDIPYAGFRIAAGIEKSIPELKGWAWPIPLSYTHGSPYNISLYTQLNRHHYSLWLHYVFNPTKEPDWANNPETAIFPSDWDSNSRSIINIDYLATRLANGIAKDRDWRREAKPSWQRFVDCYTSYKHWYSLAIENTTAISLPFSDSKESCHRELGSAMIFTANPLRDMFLTEARAWIQDIYLILRSRESVKNAIDQQQHNFAHEARGLVQTIQLDGDNSLSEISQQALYFLGSYIRVFSGEPELPSEKQSFDLHKLSEFARQYAWRHLQARLQMIKRVQNGISKELDEKIRFNLRIPSILNPLSSFFDNTVIFSNTFSGILKTSWKDFLSPILASALRQSLYHEAIIYERLKLLDSKLAMQLLHSEKVVRSESGGVLFIIEGICLEEFNPDITTEAEIIIAIIKLTSGDDRLVYKTTLCEENGFYRFTQTIYDPTAELE